MLGFCRLGLAPALVLRRGKSLNRFNPVFQALMEDPVSGRRKASSITSDVTALPSYDSSGPLLKKLRSTVSQDSSCVAVIAESDMDNGEETTVSLKQPRGEQAASTDISKGDATIEEETRSETQAPSVNQVAEVSDVTNQDGEVEKDSEECNEEEVNGVTEVMNVDETADNGKPEPIPLTKSAQKKLKKQERLALRKKEMKAHAKELKKERKEKKSQTWDNLSAEEKQAAVERAREARRVRVEESNKRKEKLMKALEAGQNLVIDFQFSEQMTQQEIAHMAQQIMFSYAANAKAEVPARLSLTSLQGAMKQHLERISGNQHWMIHREERSYLEVFSERKQDIVYLTADSENVLDNLDDSKIYIIGGMVDHNRMKYITFNKAKEHEVATARLPIQENVKLTTSTVLTVNQVVEIMLKFLECRDWEQTLKAVIPHRKVAEKKEKQDET